MYAIVLVGAVVEKVSLSNKELLKTLPTACSRKKVRKCQKVAQQI
jgi:hypothetical protein